MSTLAQLPTQPRRNSADSTIIGDCEAIQSSSLPIRHSTCHISTTSRDGRSSLVHWLQTVHKLIGWPNIKYRGQFGRQS